MRLARPIDDTAFLDAEAGDSLLDRWRDRIVAAVVGLVGLAYLVSLATWSVADPSLSHATDAPVHNWLGYPGAVVADLVMQLFGFAGLVPAALLAAFAIRRLRGDVAGQAPWRILAGGAAMLLLAGAVASLPVVGTWPLPSGLGGALGDLILSLPLALTGGRGLLPLVATASGLALLAVVALLYATALPLKALAFRRADAGAKRKAAPAAEYDHAHAEEHGLDADTAWPDEAAGDPPDQNTAETPDDGDRHSLTLGWLYHWTYSMAALIRRIVTFGRVRLPARPTHLKASLLDRLDAEERLDPASRQEPVLRPGGDDPAGDDMTAGDAWPPMVPMTPGLTPVPAAGMDDEPPASQPPMVPQSLAPQPATAAPVETPAPQEATQGNRVHGMRNRLEEGKRAAREQQISLLPGDGYEMPPLTLLETPPASGGAAIDMDALEQNARILESVLDDFGIKGDIINVRPGPVVTLYELEPAPGTKSSRVINLAEDIARSMSAISARVAVVPGRNVIGIELPNARRETVFLRELLASKDFEQSKTRLPLCLGKTIGGEPVIADLARMPHLLIAGTTGSGKSVAINTMILSLLYRLPPERCKLIMVDPKMLELSVYDDIPHLLSPVVTDPKKAVVALKWTVREMEERYRKMSKLGVRNIDGYNARIKDAAAKGETLTRQVQTGFDPETGEPVLEQVDMDQTPLPYIVVVIDEMADLMMVAGKDIEGAVQRLAQMARAAGIHVIMATQRPSVDVITGTIKANFPTRISFQVTSKIDSRTILGEQGAEHLLGQGDMLYMMGGGRIQRVHGPFVSDGEVEDIVAHLKAQGAPDYREEITEEGDDPALALGGDSGSGEGEGGDLYDQAVAIVLRDKKASTSYVQRRLSIGYNRAARLIERMEDEGVISRPNSKGQREVLVGSNEDAA